MALIFGMTLAGCGGGDGDNFGNDPITVNLSLPAIQSVASFGGTFADTEAEQKDLVKEAFEIIAALGLSGGGNGGSNVPEPDYPMWNKKSISPDNSRAVQRGAYSWGPEYETYDHNTTILPGAIVTGFLKASGKGYYKDEYGDSAGDYDEENLAGKLSIDFPNVTKNSATLNGKYVLDGTSYEKWQVISTNPRKERITENSNVNHGYALSISKGGSGIKFVMQETIKVNINNLEWTYEQGYPNYSNYITYKLTLNVYDNSNSPKLTKTFNSLEAARAYLGVGYYY